MKKITRILATALCATTALGSLVGCKKESGNTILIGFTDAGYGHEFLEQTIEKFEAACSEAGTVDKKPVLDGRFMSMVISPVKAK